MTDLSKAISSLPPEKRALLARRLKEQGSQFNTFPLSFAQQRLWFLDQLIPGSPVYNITAAIRLTGSLNVQALEQSLEEIVRRHETLRTTFTNLDGTPMQVVAGKGSAGLKLENLSELSEKEREAKVLQLVTYESQQPFDLARGPLLKLILFRLAEQEHVLLAVMHHIVSDGWSIGVLIREAATLYKAYSDGRPSPLGALPIQYADFASWQRGWLQGEYLEKQLIYWKQQLEGCPSGLKLPTDRTRPALQSFRGAHQSVALPKSLSESIKVLGHKEGATPFMVLLAALQTLLYRYTGQRDICIGTSIANRNRGETEGLIGFIVNTLVIRTELAGDLSFRDLLKRVRERALGAYAHQDLPFEMLVEKLRPERHMSHTPFFQVMFDYQNGTMETPELPGLTLRSIELDHRTTKFDLTVYVIEGPEGLSASVEYNADLFDAVTVRRMLGHYHHLLEGIVVNPDQRLSDLPLMRETERHQLVGWNQSQARYPAASCLQELFEAQVERTPNATAVTYGGERLSYQQLNSRANQLAHRLRSLGIGPDVLVACSLDRSLDLVVAILGILKAGGAYLPLDLAYPKERLAFMLEDSRAPVLLTQEYLLEQLPEHQAQVICVDADWDQIEEESVENPIGDATTANLAYVIYTSGSTGRPKGVLVTHANVVRLFEATQEWYHFDEHDVWTLFHSYAFDFSVWELWGALLYGGRLVVVPYWVSRSPEAFYELLSEEGVTVLNQTPSAFRQLIRAGETDVAARGLVCGDLSLRLVIFGGEALDLQSLKPWFDRYGDERPQLVNMYGITETTVHVSYRPIRAADLEEGKGSVIGGAIPDLQIYVLDEELRPVPIGVAGEMYVGGAGVARGYLNRPELSAERFIPDPYGVESGGRLYRTGDLARYLGDGELEYLGRIDDQVKIRGFRIELGEIEAVLVAHPGIEEAIVMAREEERGEKRLVAYLVTRPEAGLSISEVREFLKVKLPEYMVPAVYMKLGAMPLTENGKLDRRALPVPDAARPDSGEAYVAPRTPVEEVLAEIWAEVLNVAQVGINDNFFDLGGHSLLATQVISRVREACHIDLLLRHLFETPTIAGLAERIETAMHAEPGLSEPPIKPVSRDGYLPLSFAQQRLWFIDQMEPGNPSYNMPIAVRLTGALNVVALEASLNEIVRRHESLRTTFTAVNGQPRQVIAPALSLSLPVMDLSGQSEAESEAQVRKLVGEEAVRPFDLASGHLFRVRLLRLAAEEHVVLFTMHHIISDEWSLGVLVRELAALYEAYCEGRPSPLAELGIQYADYANWQREWLKGEALETQLGYWRDQLGDGLPALQLPFDRPRPAAQTYRGATHTFVLSPEVSALLKGLSRQEGVTLFMTLLAGLQTLLYRYSGQEEIVVGTDVANRNRLETEGLIGFFINHLVLRTKLGGNPTFRQLLGRVGEVTLGAYAHQDLPFDKLVGALRLERNPGQTQLFQVLFVFGNPTMPTLELPGLTLSPLRSELVMSKYDLTLFMNEREAEIRGTWRYSTELFDAATIERMSDHFETLLGNIAANPDARLKSLEMLTCDEREQQAVRERERQESRTMKLRGVGRKAVDLS